MNFLQIAENYFQSIFSSTRSHGVGEILEGIVPCISPEMNTTLLRKFTMEEVCTAVKSMNPLKASGEDGLGAIFYQRFWHIVGSEVADYCIQALEGKHDITEINGTRIVLIPNVTNPQNMGQFPPISLCNILYKLIAKMLVNRLQRVIHLCIDEAQSAFVLGSLISDNILAA